MISLGQPYGRPRRLRYWYLVLRHMFILYLLCALVVTALALAGFFFGLGLWLAQAIASGH